MTFEEMMLRIEQIAGYDSLVGVTYNGEEWGSSWYGTELFMQEGDCVTITLRNYNTEKGCGYVAISIDYVAGKM